MNGPYTLEQVKDAGVFAYQLDGGDEVPIFNPFTGELAEIVPWEGVANYGSHSWLADEDSLTDWHHLPDCTCTLCAP